MGWDTCNCRPQCGPEGSCAESWHHWRKAGTYRALYVDLGIIEALPVRLSLTAGRSGTEEPA